MTDAEISSLYIDGQIIRHKLFAELWIAKAVTGAATRHEVTRRGEKLTPEELIDRAFGIAINHINIIEEMMDARDKLLRGKSQD